MLPPILLFLYLIIQKTTKQLQCVFPSVNNIICTLHSITWQIFYGPFTMINLIGMPMFNPRVVVEISDSVYCHLEVHCRRVETLAASGDEAACQLSFYHSGLATVFRYS